MDLISFHSQATCSLVRALSFEAPKHVIFGLNPTGARFSYLAVINMLQNIVVHIGIGINIS
jgi:hypothetical protein